MARSVLLFAGLGNPGRQYRANRHNIGFHLLDRVAEKWGISFTRLQNEALVCDAIRGERKVILAKPQTLMNASGRSIAALLRFYKAEPGSLVVTYDDIDLPFGSIRIRPAGGSGGHRGMRSIIREVGSEDFARIRLGIDRPPGRMEAADYVLQDFHESELELLEHTLTRAADCFEKLLDLGLEASMNSCNPPIDE